MPITTRRTGAPARNTAGRSRSSARRRGGLAHWGQEKAAARVITRALDQGVTYCDTAPAYAGSLDYYAPRLGERRQQIFLASKTHHRSRDGSLQLLEQSLKRARTDHLDLGNCTTCAPSTLSTTSSAGRAPSKRSSSQSGRARQAPRHYGHHDPAILSKRCGV